jgi:hypothetical protein
MSATPEPLGQVDCLGVVILRGDIVRVTSWGHPVRLTDTGRVARVLGVNSRGRIVLVREGATDPDPIARGRAVDPGMLAVARRDGQPGHEGNRAPTPADELGQSADRCYDCGAEHPQWFAAYLTRLWEADNASVSPDEDAAARSFSETDHAGCFL